MKERSSTSREAREYKRLRAIELFENGMKAIKIAEVLGVTRGAVSQWLKRFRLHGIEALYQSVRKKKACKLSSQQVEDLLGMLVHGAENFGYSGDVWTGPRVRELIEVKFGIKYSIRHVERLLKKWGWTPQKPVTRPTQQNLAEVEEWLTERWPRIKKSR